MNSKQYWQDRYSRGGNSGAGSYGRLAVYKADVINTVIQQQGIDTLIELGCGDGNNLALYKVKNYIGQDVSFEAVRLCNLKYLNDDSKVFYNFVGSITKPERLTLSLDVIYHLIEDDVYHEYMCNLFDLSSEFVIIYANDEEDEQMYAPHIKCRKFTKWVEDNRPEFKLIHHLRNPYPFDPKDPKNTSMSDFYIYTRLHIND